MKKQKERRVINFDKDNFDKMKLFCEKNSLDLPAWLFNMALEKMSTITKNSMKLESSLKSGGLIKIELLLPDANISNYSESFEKFKLLTSLI